jgi:hypothetical protein
MPSNTKPARTLGGVLIFFGVMICASGAWDIAAGKPALLVAVGVGFILTGVLLVMTLKLATLAYAITCVIAVIVYVSAKSSAADAAAHDLTGALTILAVVAFHFGRRRFRDMLR